MGAMNGMMARVVMENPYVLVVPVLLLLATMLAGLLVRVFLIGALRKWAEASKNHAGTLAAETLRGSILLWFAILGLHIATQSSEIPARYLRYIPPALALLWILSLTIAASRFAGNVVRFYGAQMSGDMRPVTSLTQKLSQIVILLLGGALMLKVVFNINLTPLLATLGVGGLAVALALQDTLSNLFAGFYVSISGLIRIGDYIKLSSGEEGYVADITWRCTTMRGQANNLVIIPNNKLGQTIYTNYFLPERKLGQSLQIAVAPGSDITRVEKLLLDETLAAMPEIPAILDDPQPLVLFVTQPGDPALIFQVNFSVREFGNQARAQSELRKRLWQRLTREGVAMGFSTEWPHPNS